jgi:hypothetical protein
MDQQTLRNIQQNLANSPVRPIYADEVVVAHTIKAGKDKADKVTKEASLQLVFVDMTTQKPVDKVVITPITAMGLYKALGESIVKIEKEMKSKSMQRAKKVETDYIR